MTWDGETLADWIGQELTNGKQGFFPHGIGVPFAAVRAVCAYLRDIEVANIVATHVSMDQNTVSEVLVALAEQIEEEVG
jgi:hypothetical protein